MTEAEYRRLRDKIDTADAMFDDLPDGAYWAACEEMGVGSDVQVAVDDYEMANQLGVHAPAEGKNGKS